MEGSQTTMIAGIAQPIVAGAMGGFGSVLVGHPFETVKARLQTGVKPSWPGIRGAYAGIMPPLTGQVPFWASFYFGYSIGTALRWDDSQGAQIFAGAVAGGVSSLVLTPVDAVKIHAQVEQIGSSTAMRQVLRGGGWAGLFRALPPTMGRMVPASAVWFCTKEKCTELGCSSFVAGGMAGTMEWAAIMPIDTIKTRYTIAPKGTTLRSVVATIFHESGLQGMYRGFVPTMLRAFPANGAAFGCIDLTERYLFGKGPQN